MHTTGGEDLEFVELPEAALWSVDTSQSHVEAGEDGEHHWILVEEH